MRRPGRTSEIPPPLELECLKALWRLGSGSVKDVQELLAENKPLAYTTVMTVLERLARRGAVERQKSGRHFLYSARMDREQARHLAVRELADIYFDGSMPALREYLGNRPSTSTEAPSETHSVEALDPTLL